MADSQTEAPKAAKSLAATAANYNDDDRHPVASFITRADAEAYAKAYGGDVEAVGVAFTVSGKDADHGRARDDADKLRAG